MARSFHKKAFRTRGHFGIFPDFLLLFKFYFFSKNGTRISEMSAQISYFNPVSPTNSRNQLIPNLGSSIGGTHPLTKLIRVYTIMDSPGYNFSNAIALKEVFP